mgnify:CR=1 FL=1
MKRKTKKRLIKTISIIILLVGALITLVPFIWMVSTSFKDIADVFKYPPKFFGETFKWQNYPNVLETMDFLGMLKNTVIVTIVVAFGQLLTSSMAGFAFSYLDFRGREVIFNIFLFAIMIPFHVMLIPTFVLMKNMNLLNTLWSLILPCIISPLGIFMMRQSYMSTPRSLGEAAEIDGCSKLGIWWRIYLPLTKPTLATLAIFSFMQSWNDFIRPLIFLNSNQKMTLTLGLYNMIGNYATDWGLMMAAVIMSILPVLIFYLALQDFFVEGIAMTGLKG